MPIRIGTNVASLYVQRKLGKTDERVNHAIQALASGQRIVTASDDAAGFAIAENLKGRVVGLTRARQNAEHGTSLIQVAEGGLSEQNNIMIRLRELAVQAASDGISDAERGFLDQEFQLLTEESDRIAKSTTFGSAKLLEGSGQRFEFHVGADSDESNIIGLSLDADTSGDAMNLSGLSIADKDEASEILPDLDNGIQKLAGVRAGFGALQSRFQFAINNLDQQVENNQAARSRIIDADIAHETSELAQAQILQEMGVAVLAQANSLPQKALRLIM
ncbi:MAG: flagellin [Pseudomonadota bacterium]|nr:flagellin [Pseudomonadota bacterium]